MQKISNEVHFLIENWMEIIQYIPDNWSILYRNHVEKEHKVNSFNKIRWNELEDDLINSYGENLLKLFKYKFNNDYSILKSMFWSVSIELQPIFHILLVLMLFGSLKSLTDMRKQCVA
ncbi:hypothetical protein LJK88_37565 [Paenibacillus sp. P26]|nr:hypothetical protein LJK88_37565 [Paenibacillus sp. P26]UUZ93363.1 hypothetical protein LJK87_00740 [Paenibacillus sp. P25]